MISIREQVVSFPGILSYEQGPKKLKRNQTVIDLLMNYWLFRSNRASIILCFSVLEEFMKRETVRN